MRAAEIIGELGGLDSVPALRKGLRDREPLVRFACAHALTRVGAEGLLDEILGALAEGDDMFGQGAMAEVLLDSGPDSVSELRTLLGDPRHPQRRRLIVVVLGELRAFDAVPELTAALRDPDDELCARACHALGKIGDPDSAEPLAAVAMDGARPWFVRTAAAGACGQIGDPRTAGTLVEALDSEEWYPRNAAATRARPARGRRRGRGLQPRRLARARVGRALLGPARRRRAHRGDHRPRRARRAPGPPLRQRRGARRGDRPARGAGRAARRRPGRYATLVLGPARGPPSAAREPAVAS